MPPPNHREVVVQRGAPDVIGVTVDVFEPAAARARVAGVGEEEDTVGVVVSRDGARGGRGDGGGARCVRTPLERLPPRCCALCRSLAPRCSLSLQLARTPLRRSVQLASTPLRALSAARQNPAALCLSLRQSCGFSGIRRLLVVVKRRSSYH